MIGRIAPVLVATVVALSLLAVWSLHIDTLSPDAVDYAAVARNLVQGRGYRLDLIPFHPGLLPAVSHLPEWHGFLRPIEIAPLFAFFGIDAAWVQVPSLLYAGGTAWLLFLLGRRFGGEAAGCFAVLLFLGFSKDGVLIALGFDDAGSAFFTLLALYFWNSKGRSAGSRWAAWTGLAAALGTLEKFTGVLLPAALLASSLLRREERRALRAADVTWIVGPSALGAALYFARNYLVWGAFDFRFSALEWLAKFDASRYFAYYPVRPTVPAVWAELGVSGVMRGIARECAAVFGTALDHPAVAFGGLPALALLSRRGARFALPGLLYGAALIGSIVVGHQWEPRYGFSFACVEILAVAVVGVGLFRLVLVRLPAAGRTPAASLAALVLSVAVVREPLGQVLALRAERMRGAIAVTADPGCEGAYDFMALHTPPGVPIVSSDPWHVVWLLDRPSVIAPTNGPAALEAVVKHYGTPWALVGPNEGGGDLGADLERLKKDGSSLRPLLVFSDDPGCRVYWLSL